MGIKDNAILYRVNDREDGWISSEMCFIVSNTSSYDAAFEELKPLLESEEIIEKFKEQCYFQCYFQCDHVERLIYELKEGGEVITDTFKFVSVTRDNYRLVYKFKNAEGYSIELPFSEDFMYIANLPVNS
jgi:hypothetical protein